MSAIELALLSPIMIFVMVLMVQFGMYFHARHVALAAAKEGARVARSGGDAWKEAARERTSAYLDYIGGRLIEDPRIRPYTPRPGSRGVIVTGYAVQVVPFLRLRVMQRAAGPRECFRSPVGGTGCG